LHISKICKEWNISATSVMRNWSPSIAQCMMVSCWLLVESLRTVVVYNEVRRERFNSQSQVATRNDSYDFIHVFRSWRLNVKGRSTILSAHEFMPTWRSTCEKDAPRRKSFQDKE
jgi:hypothetical protein